MDEQETDLWVQQNVTDVSIMKDQDTNVPKEDHVYPHQGETQMKLILLEPYSQISSVQNWKKMNVCCGIIQALHFIRPAQPREYDAFYTIDSALLKDKEALSAMSTFLYLATSTI